jgi:alcohol dehydrogenase class IV
MVRPFQFARLPVIYFGAGKLLNLPGIIERYGTRIILVTGENTSLNLSAFNSLLGRFEEKGIEHYDVTITGEPSPAMIDDPVKKFRNIPVSVVAGIGGGSVLDAGKAISAMMHRDESVKEFLEGVGNKDHPGTKIPYIAIPTTSGTGSEATKNAVISEVGPYGFKKSLRHDNFVPDFALVDPELTISCPAPLTAATGMDCFTQLTEAFLSDKSSEFTDALAWEGIRAVKSSLLKCFVNASDIEARSGMSFAALTSGICLANAGLGIVHGFASSIGGLYDIPHGVVCGTLMVKANYVTVRALRKHGTDSSALMKYSRLGRLFLEYENKSDDYYIDGFLEYIGSLVNNLGLPKLKDYGIGEKDIKKICSITEMKNNPVKLNQDELIEIIESQI